MLLLFVILGKLTDLENQVLNGVNCMTIGPELPAALTELPMVGFGIETTSSHSVKTGIGVQP
jgi:hypothetical protein